MPKWGKHVAQPGHARYPSGARTVPILAQNELSGLNRMLDALHSLIYLFCVGVVSLACGRDTNQKKKKHGLLGLDTDWSFHGSFFDIIELMVLGFWLWICLDLQVLGHFLSLANDL